MQLAAPLEVNTASPPTGDGTTSQPRVLVMLGGIPLWGQERGNIQVFHALKDAGVDALFVTHKAYGHEVIQPTLDKLGLRWTPATYTRLISRGMSLREWGERIREVMAGWWEFGRAARAYRPTHIHICNEGHFINLLPVVRTLGIPVIYRLGDKPRQHRRLFRTLWRYAIIPSVSQFVCISEFIRQKLLEAGAPPEKIRVIYSYPPERPPRRSGEQLAVPDPFEGHTVAFMGQLSADKGLDLLIEAAIQLCRDREDVRFLIAGDYSWQNPFAKELMARVEALGLSDRILFLGYVDDVPALLALTDIHVCPSVVEEALGNVVLEAKQAGVPSVVFPSGGLPELIKDGVDGRICEEKTATALTAALREYLEMEPARLNEVKAAARASLACLGITKEAYTQAWKEVYEHV